MTVTIDNQGPLSGYLKVDIVGDATVAGLLGEVLNPEGVDLLVVEGWFHCNTGAAAAATQNWGFAATGVDNNALVSAFPVNAANNTDWTIVARGASEAAATAAQNGTRWGAAQYLTVTNAAQASTGLNGSLYLKYIRMD
jgi:hypothetical protein